MTDQTPASPPPAAGASDLANAPLTDPVVAAQRMEQLRDDVNFQRRVAARDPEAFAEHARLWRVAHGLPETPEPPQSPADLEKEADARVVAAMQQHADALRRQGFNEDQVGEISRGRPITMQERDWHESQYELRRRDANFMARWSSGDMEAIAIMRKHAIGKSALPVGTLADIERWSGK